MIMKMLTKNGRREKSYLKNNKKNFQRHNKCGSRKGIRLLNLDEKRLVLP